MLWTCALRKKNFDLTCFIDFFSSLLDVHETFSVKLGHLLLFSSHVLPFIKLQTDSPLYHLTSCLLFIAVDKGVKTSLRFVIYT